ncbi:unannotated protein [freshwater metagenome]|uniref:Unannotated protein n=1 Tax=freshwater metagenome TaxID=449393 RepID=A0A6J7R1L7_9ZZZZ
MLARNGLGRGEEASRCRYNSGLSLHRLEEHGGGEWVDGVGEGDWVTERHEGHVARKRLERLTLGRLSGECEGSHRAPVEGVDGGHHAGSSGKTTQLERGFVRLGTRVAEEHSAATSARGVEQSQQPLGQQHSGLVHGEVAGVAKRGHLPSHRLDHRRMGVPQGIDRDASHEVEVLDAVDVPHPSTLTTHERNRRRSVVV